MSDKHLYISPGLCQRKINFSSPSAFSLSENLLFDDEEETDVDLDKEETAEEPESVDSEDDWDEDGE